MLKVLMISICLVLSSQFVLKDQGGMLEKPTLSNLGFQNSTGQGVNATYFASFINFINSASIYYRDDVGMRLKYISDQLNSSYGTATSGFSLVQNSESGSAADNYYDSSYVYIYYNEFATASKVDKIYPNNSYLFGKQGLYTVNHFVTLFYFGQRGYGMTDAVETVVKNTILSVETQINCGCYYNDLKTISNLLKDYDSGTWSIVCSSKPSLTGYLFTYQGVATYVNPNKCYYLVWKTF